jgi:predicted amidophosphoribosyltransferase
MALKQCEQCSEMVDEAKAFCPACGHAFVSERSRGQLSDYEAKGNTVQLGQTMYNQMLSDMGLNISKASKAPEIKVEPAPQPSAEVILSPIAESTKPTPRPSSNDRTDNKGINKWVIVAIVAAVLLVLAIAAVIAAAVIIYYLRIV